MTDAALSPSRSSLAANPWLVAAVVVVPTFMEVLDTTITVDIFVGQKYISLNSCRLLYRHIFRQKNSKTRLASR